MAKIKGGAEHDIFAFRDEVPDSPAFRDAPPVPEVLLRDNLNRPLDMPTIVPPPPTITDIRERLRWLIWNTPGGISYPQAAEVLGVPEEAFRLKAHQMSVAMEIRDTGNRYTDKQGYQRIVWAGPL